MLAVEHEVFGHRGSCVRCNVLQRGRGTGSRNDHRGVFHRPGFVQSIDEQCHRRLLLTDSDIEALHSFAFLIDDRIDRNRGLAGLAVTDDQFPLSTSDRSHRVDGFDPGLHRLVDRMAFGHSRSDDFDGATNVGAHWSFAVHGIPERIENATDNGITSRDAQKRSKGSDFVPFFDAQVVAKDDHPDGFLFEIEGQTDHAARELDHLAGHHP